MLRLESAWVGGGQFKGALNNNDFIYLNMWWLVSLTVVLLTNHKTAGEEEGVGW